MWGNLVGWIIASVLALIIVGATWGLSGVNERTGVTSFVRTPGILEPLTMEIRAGTLVKMDAPGDAGTFYRAAVTDVAANEARYAAFIENGKLGDQSALGGVRAIIDGTPVASMSLLASRPEINIGYFDEATSPELARLLIATQALERVGLLHHANGNTAEAKRCFEALFALGSKLFNERVNFMEASKGIGLMRGAIAMLKEIAEKEKDPRRSEKLSDFDAQLERVYLESLDKPWRIVNSVEPKTIARHAGDIYLFTTPEMKERMWRVESILKLGRFKFNVGGASGRMADQLGVETRLAEIEASEKDPVILAAVKAARNLSQQEYHRIK